MEVPVGFKAVMPYIRRAEEFDRSTSNPDAKTLAYFCRSYAMERSLRAKDAAGPAPENNAFLFALMNKLEADRPSVPSSSMQDGKIICENFAFSIFSRADDEDRAAPPTKNTAKAFYAAACMFDILEQFGEVDAEVEAKRKYAKWKAADITKAFKEGRIPQSGGGDQDFGAVHDGDEGASMQSTPAGPASMILPPAAPTTPPFIAPPPAPGYGGTVAPPPMAIPQTFVPPQSNNPPPQLYSPPSQPAYAPVPPPVVPQINMSPAPVSYQPPAVSAPLTTAPATYAPVPAGQRGAPKSASDPRVKDAIEFAEFAIAAMKHNELALAKDRLQEAIRRLEQR